MAAGGFCPYVRASAPVRSSLWLNLGAGPLEHQKRGRQRSLAHYATSAERVETQIARALDLARKLRTNTLYGDAERGA